MIRLIRTTIIAHQKKKKKKKKKEKEKKRITIYKATQKGVFVAYADSDGPDQPALPRRLIRTSTVYLQIRSIP